MQVTGEHAGQKKRSRSQDECDLSPNTTRTEPRMPRTSCPVCQQPLKQSQKLRAVRQSVLDGLDLNPLLVSFFEHDAARQLELPQYHTLNEQVAGLRKEITETMAVCQPLMPLLTAQPRTHVVDLCSGRSWSAAFLSLNFPQVRT